MKTKSFLLFSTSVFATSIFLIVFHSQQPQSIQNIVTQTHQHIKDFQASLSPQDNLRDVEESNLVQEERYLRVLGLDGTVERWHNTTVPAIVTYGIGDAHAIIISFIRAMSRLPYTILVYNVGMKAHSLAMVWSHCNSSRCAVVELDLSEFPSHVSDEDTHAYRPLLIQHALSRVGGVIFCESWQQWTGSAAELGAVWARAAGTTGATGGSGLVAWPRRAAVTSLTHPRMFHYFHAALDDFLFVQMLDVTRLVLAPRAPVPDIMRPWVQCALTLDCIMPIGAQSGGCRFDKKPQYRYSGCHGQDASALSILAGLRGGFEEGRYTAGRAGESSWRRVSPAEAHAPLANTTDDRPDPSSARRPL